MKYSREDFSSSISEGLKEGSNGNLPRQQHLEIFPAQSCLDKSQMHPNRQLSQTTPLSLTNILFYSYAYTTFTTVKAECLSLGS